MRRPFQANGPTIALQITSISSAICISSLTTAGTNSGFESVSLYNSSTMDAYIWIANTSVAGNLATTVSSGPYPSFQGYPIPFHQTRDLSISPNSWISGVTTAAALVAVVMVTPGSGGI